MNSPFVTPAPILLGSTPRPLVGQIVEVPAHLYTPKVWCDQRRKELPCLVGRIVEAHPTLVAVGFFDYPHTVDYTLREAAQFTLNPA